MGPREENGRWAGGRRRSGVQDFGSLQIGFLGRLPVPGLTFLVEEGNDEQVRRTSGTSKRILCTSLSSTSSL